MACKDCYNGCAETTSDKCVKYTGPNIPELGIETGDNLASVEADIIAALISALNGSGIVLSIPARALCSLVAAELPPSGPVDLNAYITALINAICNLDQNVNINSGNIAVIEADYVIPCSITTTPGAGTHQVLQATMNFVCNLSAEVQLLELNLTNNYTPTVDLETYVLDVITNNPDQISNPLQRTKMVPYTVVEYYGSLSFFDATGAGIGNWIDVYLCNGMNNTPDKRGRVGVGTTSMLGTIPLDPAVVPGGLTGLNPDYTFLSSHGTNGVQLSVNTMPSHTHTTLVSTEGDHTHEYLKSLDGRGFSTADRDRDQAYQIDDTVDTEPGGEHTHTVTIDPAGGGGYHDNVQPGLACYYIMYIPAP